MNKINKNVIELSNMLMTTNHDVKTSMYGAIGLYVVNNLKECKTFLNLETLDTTIYSRKVKDVIYELNDVTVIDMDLLATVIDKIIMTKKQAFTIDGFIRESQDITDVIGVSNFMGDYIKVIDTNFNSFRSVYNLLVKINYLK